MECFHEGEHMLYIDPVECIDCDACVPQCPVEAIFPEDDVPADQREFITRNAEMSKVCPSITLKKTPLSRRKRVHRSHVRTCRGA
jgi:ferredoxin